ncbi:hypothetical protein F5050DRAFT_1450371 [Lentinula boryana]|uniref:Uncharacterized protein n=1 Tax=Lentinula boryana TaxID=40481 RepID=A0ABQ8QFF5_9AGAR|nr:hypothetical protein F5050DRAFT_1450371 [Lentinula boryana]
MNSQYHNFHSNIICSTSKALMFGFLILIVSMRATESISTLHNFDLPNSLTKEPRTKTEQALQHLVPIFADVGAAMAIAASFYRFHYFEPFQLEGSKF